MMKQREIGSEFWDVPIFQTTNSCFPKSTQGFLSGRSALQAIIMELGEARSASLPSWCCDSMIKPFADAGMEICFYPVYWQDGLVQEPNLGCDVLFLMDYFGYTTSVPDLSSYKGVVIRDVTHSVFSSVYFDADYYFGSLRKWCGVWTGGFAWTKDGHTLPTGDSDDFGFTALRKKAMDLKNGYISGRGAADKGYLRVFSEAEEALEHVGIAPAAERDVELMQRLDTDYIQTRRRENAKVLMDAFEDMAVFSDMKDSDCPMFVPILVPDGKRDELRRYLIKQGIYCPVHWPISDYHRLTEQEQFIYDHELSLVCDQRYTKQDMNRIVDAIRRFWEEMQRCSLFIH